uniref:Uncharacterized protein n=1 Tax=Xiphophorus couchianus TaxID=32473 RepID=A0A3B5LQW6_9TELE
MTEKLRDRQRDTMTINTLPNGTTVTELDTLITQNKVFNKSAQMRLIESCFSSLSYRKLKMHNLWEYTSMRKSLLSKRIYVLVSLCDQSMQETSKKGPIKPRGKSPFYPYVLSVNGGNPMMKWQMEKGLDWTISSVGGESYRVEVNSTVFICSVLAAEGLIAENLMKYNPTWKDASFTLKYYSDALFDFPHWLGHSKRSFQASQLFLCIPNHKIYI